MLFCLSVNLLSRWFVIIELNLHNLILTDGVKLVQSKRVEISDDEKTHFLKLFNCRLDDAGEIKFVSKTAESTCKLKVMSKYITRKSCS